MPEKSNVRKKLRTQDLIILGLLKESPKHGYELKNIVDERLQYLAEITSGTVYYTLKKLQKNGFVTCRKEREGDRPERNVFSITDKGEEHFLKLLEDSFRVNEKMFNAFNVGLYFVKYIDFDLVIDAIDKKKEYLEQSKQVVMRLEESYPVKWPFHLEAIKERVAKEIEMHTYWYEKLKKKLAERKRKT